MSSCEQIGTKERKGVGDARSSSVFYEHPVPITSNYPRMHTQDHIHLRSVIELKIIAEKLQIGNAYVRPAARLSSRQTESGPAKKSTTMRVYSRYSPDHQTGRMSSQCPHIAEKLRSTGMRSGKSKYPVIRGGVGHMRGCLFYLLLCWSRRN